MLPKYFGPGGRQLFGAYHAPAGGSPRPLGVVLCNPGPHEYRQSHWAIRKLAVLLAKHGLHVLRFDYFATGDSAGDSAEGSLDQWVGDIHAAAEELRDISGVRQVALVGMRLGAALAVRAATGRLALADLVLWDPVVSGAAYLAQLEAVQAQVLRERHYPEDNRQPPDELLGYLTPATMRHALAAVDLLDEPPAQSPGALVIAADDRPEYRQIHGRLQAAGVAVGYQVVPDATLAGNAWISDTLLAHHIPEEIAAYLARRAG